MSQLHLLIRVHEQAVAKMGATSDKSCPLTSRRCGQLAGFVLPGAPNETGHACKAENCESPEARSMPSNFCLIGFL